MKKIFRKLAKVDEKLSWEGWAKFQDPVGYVYDKDVAKFAWEHMKFKDKLSFRKITSAVLSSFAIVQEPDFKESEYSDFKFDF